MTPVITATPNGMGDLVVRWRFTVSGPALVSASRYQVMIHGPVDLASVEPWLDGARQAHEALRAGRLEEAAALATHEDRGCDRDFVPIERTDG